MEGEKIMVAIRKRDRIKNFILGLKRGSEFTSHDVSKKFDMTVIEAGMFLKVHDPILIVRGLPHDKYSPLWRRV